MNKILVSGLINFETTLRVDSFPLEYEPVRYPFFGVNSTISGVGYNVAKALTKLGSNVNFLSIIGDDILGDFVLDNLSKDSLKQDYLEASMTATAQSVIIYDQHGQRQIHTDLKDIQDNSYPLETFQRAMNECATLVLCNINYNRAFLKLGRKSNKVIATDVHTIADLEDEYNQDFMAAADILFLSDELLPCPPEDFIQQLQNHYKTPIIVIGMGKKGALLAVKRDKFVGRIEAVYTRPVLNTIGAGDALFSAFVHAYSHSKDPYVAIRKAVLFASYKIGTAGGADGYLTGDQLNALYRERDAGF